MSDIGTANKLYFRKNYCYSFMSNKRYYIIDFDNTFTQVEALDELARISLTDRDEKEKILQEIEDLTNLAMEGKLSFSESLSQRVRLLDAKTAHLDELISILKKKVSKSFARNAAFFKQHSDDVLIVSGGFKEFIIPVVTDYHIKQENIYANTFVTTGDGRIIDYDHANPLSEEGGKVKLLRNLQLQGELFGIGDGYSDYQLKESGMISKFFAFTENISRKSVTEKADHITPSFDEFLYLNNLPGTISYPKNRIICLIVGEVRDEYIDILEQDGLTVKKRKSLDTKYLKEARIILLGKNVTITKDEIKTAKKLRCLGITDYIEEFEEQEYCSKQGIVVYAGNTKTRLADRLLGYINEGTIFQSLNFPDLVQPKTPDTHRIILTLRNNKPSFHQVLEVFYQYPYKILSATMRMSHTTSIVAVDIEKMVDKSLVKQLRKLPATIHARILY